MDFPVYDWNKDFEVIIKSIYLNDAPIIIKSFFNDEDQLPKSEKELEQQIGERDFETQRFNLEEFKNQIRHSQYLPLKKELHTFSSYKKKSQELKTGENLILKEWAKSLSEKINQRKIFEALPSGTNEDHYFRFLLGFKGHITDPHFDWVPYHNILFQLYGEKEVLLVHPDHFEKIPFIANFSELNFENLYALIQEEGIPSFKITIKSGEGVTIPPYFLHSVKYVSDSASLSLRMLPILNNEKVHRHLPAKACLASNLLRGMSVDLIQDPDHHPEYAKAYESYLLEKKKDFEAPLNELNRRKSLIDQGAAYFSPKRK